MRRRPCRSPFSVGFATLATPSACCWARWRYFVETRGSGKPRRAASRSTSREPRPRGLSEPRQRAPQSLVLYGGGGGEGDLVRRRRCGRGRGLRRAGDRRLQDPHLGDGPITEIAVDALEDRACPVLHLDGSRARDPEHEHRAFAAPAFRGVGGFSLVAPPRPDDAVGRGEGGKLGADDGRPICKERRGGEAACAGRGIERAGDIGADRAARRLRT